MSKFLFGIKPTGNVHVGHLECLKEYKKEEVVIFIANVHACVSNADNNIGYLLLTKQFIALGFKPEQIIVQSKIDFLFETLFFLSIFSKDSEMRRMHLYKEKTEKKLSILSSEYLYPILMTADIMLSGIKNIIIGKDQVQHIEIAKSIFLKLPFELKGKLNDINMFFTPCINGIDGRKMSKSYNNTISFFDSENEIIGKINKISTLNIKKDEQMKSNELINICNNFIDDIEYKKLIDESINKMEGFYKIKTILKDFILNKRRKIIDKMNLLNDEEIEKIIVDSSNKINQSNKKIKYEIKKYLML